MTVEQAVARIALIAEAVETQRSAEHGVVTPWHITFDSGDGTGRPTVLSPSGFSDPLRCALYAAPELADATTPPTQAAEVYALGCMLFEAIAGRPPYQGKTQEELAKRHATAAAPAVRMVRRDCELPPSLEVEIQHALRKRPGDRHPKPSAFARAIRAANREDDRATMAFRLDDPSVVKEIAARTAAQAAQAAPPVAPLPPKNSKVMLIVALLAIVGLGSGLAWFVLRDTPQPAKPVPVAPPKPAEPVPPDVAVADVAEPEDATATVDTADTADAPDLSGDVAVEEPTADPARARVRPKQKVTDPGPAKGEEPPKRREGGPAVF